MGMATAFAAAALVASIVLLMQRGQRVYPVVAVIVSGLEVAMSFGIVSLNIKGLPLLLVLGGILTAMGVIMLMRAMAKNAVVAATIVTLIGALQVLLALNIVH